MVMHHNYRKVKRSTVVPQQCSVYGTKDGRRLWMDFTKDADKQEAQLTAAGVCGTLTAVSDPVLTWLCWLQLLARVITGTRAGGLDCDAFTDSGCFQFIIIFSHCLFLPSAFFFFY